MLLFDESKIFEKAIGSEATAVLDRILERQNEKSHEGMVTKEDLYLLRQDLKDLELRLMAETGKVRAEINGVKVDIVKWVAGIIVAQSAVIAALVKLLS
ncbi:MAG: hypothetical protein LBV76_04010 [Deltaproteobacteria bacterium]|jgi:hypothetical protein|nr:hypothetical protein [Deltaproteobacteria bacterium]